MSANSDTKPQPDRMIGTITAPFHGQPALCGLHVSGHSLLVTLISDNRQTGSCGGRAGACCVPERARTDPAHHHCARCVCGRGAYRGTLEIRGGCIVTSGSRRNFTVLFDPGVVLTSGSDGLYEPRTGNTIRFGHKMQGGGNLRENGKGWPISDIERFYEVSIPRGCPKNNVMRLHKMEEVAE